MALDIEAGLKRAQDLLLPDEERTAEEGAFYQRRLGFLTRSGFGLSVLAGTIVVISGTGDQRTLGQRIAEIEPTIIPWTGALLFLAVWIQLGWRRWGRPVLDLVDALLIPLLVLHAVVAAVYAHGIASPVIALLMATLGTVFRAVVVPSSPGRTLAISAVSMGLVIAGVYLVVDRRDDAVLSMPPSVFCAWAAAGAAQATLASHVVFGLRRQVQEARRLGQYTLLQRIGEGGMGTVYEARHAFLQRPTAVKVLKPELTDAEALLRFEREVQLTASLTHPNTVDVFDYGRTPDGIFYYAMEYLDGANLEDLVRATGPMRASRVVYVLRQIAASLREAHEVGLVHRDIKSANIVLCRRGGRDDFVKVVDFGLAQKIEADLALDRPGAEAPLIGTPTCLAPELIAGSAEPGVASDLYALGCVAYELLAGRPPFVANSVLEVLRAHLDREPERLAAVGASEVPDMLETLVLWLLAKEPDLRPRSAEEVLAALREVETGEEWGEVEARRWWRENRSRLGSASRIPSPADKTSGFQHRSTERLPRLGTEDQ